MHQVLQEQNSFESFIMEIMSRTEPEMNENKATRSLIEILFRILNLKAM